MDQGESKTTVRAHSVKVPRVYKIAASILSAYFRGEGSIKDLVYNQPKKKRHPRVNAILALTSEAVRNEKILTKLFSVTHLIENEYPLDPSLAKILAVELLWGNGLSKAGDSKPVANIRAYESKFKANVSEEQIQKEPVSKHQIPRYVRINTLKACDTSRILSTLENDGFEQISYRKSNVSYPDFLEMVQKLEINQFLIDYHIQGLLAFGPGTVFFQYKLYDDGLLILQDKASCLAVEALNPSPGSIVLDACAAPGMKTLQGLAKINSDNHTTGKLIAVEKNGKRCKTLRSLLEKFGAEDVKILNKDFLDVNPIEYRNVEYIILDPSCSGSGIFHRNDKQENDVSEDRLTRLANFQAKLLRHALSFPNVKRVAYSTCSVHKSENEEVVFEVLNGRISGQPCENFQLASNCLPTWERRGLSEFGCESTKFIRSAPIDDLGIGFFVAVLERITDLPDVMATSKKRKQSDKVDSWQHTEKKARTKL